MKAPSLLASVLAIALVLPAIGAHAQPTANKYQTTLTDPTAPTGATVKITKPSKVQIKVSTGSVTFVLKMKGVLNTADDTPNTSTGNTFSVQFLVGGVTHNKDFVFDLAGGGLTPSSTLKFPVALSDAGTWGSALSPGTPIEIRRIRVIENATGEDFGIAGLTTK